MIKLNGEMAVIIGQEVSEMTGSDPEQLFVIPARVEATGRTEINTMLFDQDADYIFLRSGAIPLHEVVDHEIDTDERKMAVLVVEGYETGDVAMGRSDTFCFVHLENQENGVALQVMSGEG